jgi:hypothetical protein
VKEVTAAGLFKPKGVFLGRMGDAYLRHDGPRACHVLRANPLRQGRRPCPADAHPAVSCQFSPLMSCNSTDGVEMITSVQRPLDGVDHSPARKMSPCTVRPHSGLGNLTPADYAGADRRI